MVHDAVCVQIQILSICHQVVFISLFGSASVDRCLCFPFWHTRVWHLNSLKLLTGCKSNHVYSLNDYFCLTSIFFLNLIKRPEGVHAKQAQHVKAKTVCLYSSSAQEGNFWFKKRNTQMCPNIFFCLKLFLEFSFEITHQTLKLAKDSMTKWTWPDGVRFYSIDKNKWNKNCTTLNSKAIIMLKITDVIFFAFLFVCFACFKSVCPTPLSHCDQAAQTMDWRLNLKSKVMPPSAIQSWPHLDSAWQQTITWVSPWSDCSTEPWTVSRPANS